MASSDLIMCGQQHIIVLTKWIVPIMPKITNHSTFYDATCWLVFLNSFLFALSTVMNMCCFLTIHCYRPSLFWGRWGNIHWLLCLLRGLVPLARPPRVIHFALVQATQCLTWPWPQCWFMYGHFPNVLNIPLRAFSEHKLAIYKQINLS